MGKKIVLYDLDDTEAKAFYDAFSLRFDVEVEEDVTNIEFQTRSEVSGIAVFSSLAEALMTAARDPDIWKISFNVGKERVRLVRPVNSHSFVLEQMPILRQPWKATDK